MSTKLDCLLNEIDPAQTVDETFNRANQAINTFGHQTARIEQWADFTYCMVEFLRHVESTVLHLYQPIEVSSEYYWGRCAVVLAHLYGRQGAKAAFEMARTGNEGGLYGILKAVAMKVAEEYSENEISARVSSYWEGLSADEQLEAVEEYLARYGYLLSSELTEGSAARIRANFTKVLQQHPHLLQRFRRVGHS